MVASLFYYLYWSRVSNLFHHDTKAFSMLTWCAKAGGHNPKCTEQRPDLNTTEHLWGEPEW